ncbi:PTS sugar transporter subunit IIC [Olsenella sp. Marseille-P4559]|uniref:PTS sugar transporter subunit IIC n=1 Tax=Olsenella sp. Marseille-P4559 TaxID=2364795 RepID=UPI0010301B77|nr:PTS transporter subunit EIIC [Olsenella sp. Marseille-P4559]
MSEQLTKPKETKFEKVIGKYLNPIANWMDKEIHLSAIKKAMVGLTPLLIIGSFCLIPEAIPNMIGEDNAVSQWILANLGTIYIPYKVGMALMSLYASAIMAYHMAKSYELDVPGCLSMGVIAFLILSVDYTEDGGIATTYLGPKGLFTCMFGTLIAVELFRWCKKKNFTIKMPEAVPDFVSRSFEMIPISVIIIGFFLIIRIFCTNVLGVLPPLIFTAILAPLVGSMDNPFAYMFLKMLHCLLFFFGIHPSVLSPITSPISTQFLAENIANYQAGLPMTHFFTPGPMSAFGNFTGTGITGGLVIWCCFSKSDAIKKIGRVAFIPMLFGINEPILFGLPIVLNPIFFLPYVIGGGIISTVDAFAVKLGLLTPSFFTPPYVGVFLEGYLTNLDWRSLVVNAIQLGLSLALYYPFFKMYERRFIEKEIENENKGSKLLTDEDQAILDDLDLGI